MIFRLAILMTCYNRRETTLNCLLALYQQRISKDTFFEVYLVDDGSTDGTEAAIRREYPKINIIKGDGNLFWCGGMRLAWEEASKFNYDAYLWLNDDTILLPNAINSLLETALIIKQDHGQDGLIVGSCYDPNSGLQTYGGRLRNKQESFVRPSDIPIQCDIINGNIVLIPRNIFKIVGNISSEFVHLGGDNDYGLRAIKSGFKIWVAPNFQGICESHPYLPWSDPNISLSERWKHLHSPKGQPPYEVYVYAKRHSGFFWPKDLAKLYFRVLFPRLYNKIKILRSINN